MANDAILSCSQFPQFLVSQEPVYDKLILADIRPTDGWITHVETGTFEAYSGTQHTLDRFNHVFPNITKTWRPTQAGNCLGTPCDKTENCIGWGATRLTYFLEEQSWATPLLCYDQDMHITHAKEHFRQIISDILKPATSAIMSNFLRKRVAQFSQLKWVASAGMTPFNFNWVLAGALGDEEWFIDCDQMPTSKLTPQMLQRRVAPLMLKGYFGKQPFKDMPPLIELVSDMETCWELDHLANSGGNFLSGNVPSISGNWRFEQWDAASKFWRYGFSGQIGNYAVRVDPMGLRFRYIGVVNGRFRFQVVLPYRNVPSSGAGGASGLMSVENEAYQQATYAFSYIYHRRGVQALVADATPVNPEMPFSSRNFGGRWQFVMDNLGTDINGCVIENKRRNKGQFISDFKLAIRPQYTEFLELIFHKREPACVIPIDVCTPDTNAYPTDYNSCLPGCNLESTVQETLETAGATALTATVTFTPPTLGVGQYFNVIANTATCEGGPIGNGAVTNTTPIATGANTLALLVQALNTAGIAAHMGTWAVASPTTITLTGTCHTAYIAIVAA